MKDTRVVTGKPAYVNKRVAEFTANGYTVVKRHVHPNNDITVKLERE